MNNGLYPGKRILLTAQFKFIGFLLSQLVRRHKWLILGTIIFAIVIGATMWGKNYFVKPSVPKTGYLTDTTLVEVRIPVGTSGKTLIEKLVRKDLVRYPWWAGFLFRTFSYQNRIKAGIYAVPDTLNNWQVFEYLSHAPVKLRKLTIPEGLTISGVGKILEKNAICTFSTFDSLCHDVSFIRSLGIPDVTSLEGYLLPDTYFFQYDEPVRKIISRFVAENNAFFHADSIRNRLHELNMSRHQILTLASVIQGEIIYFDEAPVVASVYHNRLKKGWRLQADPTIQYILKDAPRRLTYRDLQIDSPYNTYKYKGLPPGPINNPGIIAIKAALYPAQTNYMYFVATGDGKHHFSVTSREHINWKKKFNRIRKKVYGK